MPRSPLPWLLPAFLLAAHASVCFGGSKKVSFQTIPPGAEVEVNGSITCTTPCSIDVPDYYFGEKHTVWSKHGIAPIIVRLTKEGYAPKTVEVTTGPLHWKSFNGANSYDYYLVTSTVFNIRLDPVSNFFDKPESSPVPTTSRFRLNRAPWPRLLRWTTRRS